ncbi:MAG: hypothetical protein U1F51_21650 [Burkholderiales bacterium]
MISITVSRPSRTSIFASTSATPRQRQRSKKGSASATSAGSSVLSATAVTPPDTGHCRILRIVNAAASRLRASKASSAARIAVGSPGTNAWTIASPSAVRHEASAASSAAMSST